MCGGVRRPLQALSDLPEGSKVKITIARDRPHPLLEFAGILRDSEAAELQRLIASEFDNIVISN